MVGDMRQGSTRATLSRTPAGTPDGALATTRQPHPGADAPAYPSTTDAPRVTLQPFYSDAGCACQTYGKSGVPYPSGKCIVCGYRVNLEGAVS